MKRWTKRLLWVLVAVLLALAVARAFRSPAVLVDEATIARGTLLVTADDDGRTRVRERYTISAPLDGRLLRTPLEAGSPVRAGETVVAELEPRAPSLLDERARAEALARVERAARALEQARALERQARADLDFAAADLQRQEELRGTGSLAEQELDRARRDQRRAAEALQAARSAVGVAEEELEVARAALLEGPQDEPSAQRAPSDGAAAVEAQPEPGSARGIALFSPVDGRVLRVLEESARTVTAGTPLIEVGDTTALEVVADYLSQDAVLVRPGMEVLVEGWGADRQADGVPALRGRVRLVEPGGFTKVSALGVEEQRVNVVVDPVEPLAGWEPLGDGYRVELRIVLERRQDVTIVPTGALFREGERWAAFVVEGGQAQRRTLSLGRRNGLEAEVLEGLREGERVVLYPSELVEDGVEVRTR